MYVKNKCAVQCITLQYAILNKPEKSQISCTFTLFTLLCVIDNTWKLPKGGDCIAWKTVDIMSVSPCYSKGWVLFEEKYVSVCVPYITHSLVCIDWKCYACTRWSYNVHPIECSITHFVWRAEPLFTPDISITVSTNWPWCGRNHIIQMETANCRE